MAMWEANCSWPAASWTSYADSPAISSGVRPSSSAIRSLDHSVRPSPSSNQMPSVLASTRYRNSLGSELMGTIISCARGCRSDSGEPVAGAGTHAGPHPAGAALRCAAVARGGVEPPTYRFSVDRSYQLSYLAEARGTLPEARRGTKTGAARLPGPAAPPLCCAGSPAPIV